MLYNSGYPDTATMSASSAMLPSNKTVVMPTCYCKQKLTTLAPPQSSSDWSTALEWN